ncbi:MAG: hypothetical protein IJS50_00890, partial [Desulfovibrio sp.]|nr:hypothetical protein [Desulfovibrio sp.]
KRSDVDFSNNISERGLRILKLWLKISGCFKNLPSSAEVCLIISYIETCEKHGITSVDALNMLFSGKLPDFIDLSQAYPSLFENEEEKEETSEENTTEK